MRKVFLLPLLTAASLLLFSFCAQAAEPSSSDLDQISRFSLAPLTAEETRLARMAQPDAQSQLLAEVFPGARPDSAGGMSPLREDYSLNDRRAFLRVEGGAEVVDNRMAFRLGAGGSLYTADRRLGLRLDAAAVQGDAQREMLKLLLSAGAKLGQQNQLVFSAGWLNRYAWGDFDGVGEQGDNLSQYVLGLELERQLRQESEDASPGIAAFLTALYFQSESKTVWSGARIDENNSLYYRYFYEYGLAGGSQYETLAGLRFSLKRASLELQAGFRHKEYEEYLGNASSGSDAPKAAARLTLGQVLGNELSAHYTWDPDLRVAGAGLRRPLGGRWSLSARAEQAQGEDRAEDLRYYLGLDYWFGGSKPARQAQTASASSMASQRREKAQEAEEDRRQAQARGDWLKPVRGSEVEYLQVLRQVQRKTRVWEVEKSGLASGVTVDKKAEEIVISGLPGATSVVLVSPSAAWPAFTISGGVVKIAINKLVAGQDHLAQIEQSGGVYYSMVRVKTSQGSIIVNSVQYNTNLTDCQVAAIFSNPELISNPPAPAPAIDVIPEQTGTVNASFSLDLSAFVHGSGISAFELTGSLPAGLYFDARTGLLSGKPTQQGVFYLGLRARNSCDWSVVAPITLIINSSGGGSCDNTSILFSGWFLSGNNPVPGVDSTVNFLSFATGSSVTASNLTVNITPNAGSATTTLVNDDGGTGKQWHIETNFLNAGGATSFNYSVQVKNGCGALTDSFSGTVNIN